MLEKFFNLKANKTTIGTEIIAGMTTFFAMAYILFVNPSVLGATGMDKGAVFAATGLITAIATIFMGLVAKYPFAIAPGLGINAFFAYTLCLGMGVKWQTALSAVLVAGLLFLILTLTGLREKIINMIPQDFKAAISAGIGLFITFLGLQNSGIIVKSPQTLVTLGNLTDGAVLLAIFGIFITFILYARKVPAAIFVGMLATTIAGIIFKIIELPSSIVSSVPSLSPTFGQAIINLPNLNDSKLWVAIITFLLVAFFDTAGTIVGLARQGGFLDKNDQLPRAGRALMADSIGTIGGAILGTSPTTAYIESSSGIAAGGKTGLTSVTTGLMFLISLFFSPLLSVVTYQVTAPALIIVGVLMATNLSDINWKDFPMAAAGLLTVVGMPLTYSISDGIAIGVVTYVILMLATGRHKEVNYVMYGLAAIFVVFLAFLR